MALTAHPAPPPSAKWGWTLFVSDSPELIPPLNNLVYTQISPIISPPPPVKTNTLARAAVPLLPLALLSVRCYVWHVNRTGDDLWIHLLASSSAPEGISLSNGKQQTIVSGNPEATGYCISKAQLYQTLDPLIVPGQIGQTETKIISQKLLNNQHLGALVQFDLLSTTSTTLQLRTCASPSSAIAGGWADPCADEAFPLLPGFESRHIRGWWPFSEAAFPCSSFNVDSRLTGPIFREYGVCENTGGEHGSSCYGLGTSGGPCPGSRGNIGCYGADLYYDIPLLNTNDVSEPAHVTVIARNTTPPNKPQTFFTGAGRILDSAGYPARGILHLEYADPNNPNDQHINLVTLTRDAANNPAPVMVPPGGRTIRVSLAVGGTATTPCSILVSRRSFDQIPPGSSGES